MRALLAFGLVAALLAGCTSPAAEPAGESTSSGGNAALAAGGAGALNRTAPRLVATTTHINETGNLGVMAGACVFVIPPEVPTGPCQFPDPVVPGKNDFLATLQAGNVTAASAIVTWQAASPATATFFLGAMVMGECAGCNVTILQEASGPSPLTVSWTGRIPVGEGQQVHFYVYNHSTIVADPNVPGFAYASADQEFQFAGTFTAESKA